MLYNRRSSFASFLWPPAERKEASKNSKRDTEYPLKKDRSGSGKIAGTAFWQRRCSDLTQKDCPAQRKGVSFCRPISG